MSTFKELFQTRIASRPNTETEERIRQLHLSATKQVESGEFDKAIKNLSEAQELMPTVATEYPIQQYLRLPLTLQKAGRFDEAVSEFNRLLDSDIKPYHKPGIYDKLRLAHQREGRHREAIVFGILCFAWECIALAQQNRDWSFLMEEPDRWLKQVKKSLKAIHKEDKAEIIVSECTLFARRPHEQGVDGLISAIRELLG